MSGTTRVSRYQKGKARKVKTSLDLLEQEIVVAVASVWLYASLHLIPDNHANIPPLSFFTGRMPFLPPNQQRQSTEGKSKHWYQIVKNLIIDSLFSHGTWEWQLDKICSSIYEYCTFTRVTHTQPFYGSVEFVRENPGEPVPEETFTHYSHRSHQLSLSAFSI